MDYPETNTGHVTPEKATESLVAVQDTFRQLRPYILEHAGKSEFQSKADDGSPVTPADIEAERRIRAELARRCPDIPVFGEETGYDENNLPDTCLLVDPIDGTKNFINNESGFTCMAVLIHNGEAVASTIYNPRADAMFTAQKNKGAYKNGIRLDLQAIPLPHTALCKDSLVDSVNALLKPTGVTCQAGQKGGGYEHTLVADGQIAARINLLGRGRLHDYPPGTLLISEAGGVIIPIQDDIYTYKTRSYVACHPALAPAIHAHVSELRALEQKMRSKK